MAKLNGSETHELRAPSRHGDGAGLSLHVRPGGSRSWLLRVMLRDRRTDFGLGAHPEVGLAEAQNRAREWRRLIRAGQDPRAAAIASTFALEAAVREFHVKHAAEWAPGHAARWIGSLGRHVLPELGAQPMGAIKPHDLAEILALLWTEKHNTAKRVRQRIRACSSGRTRRASSTARTRWRASRACCGP